MGSEIQCKENELIIDYGICVTPTQWLLRAIELVTVYEVTETSFEIYIF